MPPADRLALLGVQTTEGGGSIRVWSRHATAIECVVFDPNDRDWAIESIPLRRGPDDVWSAQSPLLMPGAVYALRATGPQGHTHAFDPTRALIDPYTRGVVRSRSGQWRSVVVNESFDWVGSQKPGIPLDHTIVYEAHAKGLTRLSPHMPEELRGSYAGLAHESTIAYLKDLGVTSVELLPVHQSASEERLQRMGLVNYWGYNTLAFFAPHAAYATAAARAAGPDAVLREFKGMVKLLHEAGLEVILDVVYNHTSEEGRGGPVSSFRGLDNASYYRQTADGSYVDTAGTGNTIDTSVPAVQRLVLDSLRYWAEDCQVDGFRFDLAVALGRDAGHEFRPEHPLLLAIRDDPLLAGVKLIAEPWDVGMGGWQVGGFPSGWSEWNDGYRDRMRNFWLRDVAAARETNGLPSEGIGPLARRLAGSSHVFPAQRGPLASVNFVTAHDGFTLADLVSYDEKHNLGNGEENRDGGSDNKSWNHGIEGPTKDAEILATRRRAMRNLMGTLLLSAGIPMITAGDEIGRSQRGNNNAYCHDSELTWVDWELADWQRELHAVVRRLIRLRRENPALRPVRYGRWGETTKSATQMDWYNKAGLAMTMEDWDSPAERTLQYLAASTPEFEDFNRILLVLHGLETQVEVVLPAHEGVSGYTLLWDSSLDDISGVEPEYAVGTKLAMGPTSIKLFRAHNGD